MKWWKQSAGEFNIGTFILRDGIDALILTALAVLSTSKGDKATLNIFDKVFGKDRHTKSIISSLSSGERRKAEFETITLVVFMVIYTCLEHFVVPEIINEYIGRFCKKLMELEYLKSDEEFNVLLSLIDIRIREYDKRLAIQEGAGPLWHLGRVAIKNIFGDEHEYEMDMIMSIMSSFAFFKKPVVDVISKYNLPTSNLESGQN